MPHRFNDLHRYGESHWWVRTNTSMAQAVLWRHLQHWHDQGRPFEHLYPVGPYVLDFYCPAERLAVELDRKRHEEAGWRAYALEREQHLAGRDIRVMYVEEQAVFEDVRRVLATIEAAFKP